jgi:hypothetical protein
MQSKAVERALIVRAASYTESTACVTFIDPPKMTSIPDDFMLVVVLHATRNVMLAYGTVMHALARTCCTAYKEFGFVRVLYCIILLREQPDPARKFVD